MTKCSKTREEILNQDYISAKELKVIIPYLGIESCRKIILETREEMESEYYVPPGKTKVALTWLVKKKLGIKK